MGKRNMNIERIAALLTIGELALQLHKAQSRITAARYDYHDKLRKEGFESRPDPRADEGTEAHEAVKATEKEFAALNDAKSQAYNIKRRLQTACRKF